MSADICLTYYQRNLTIQLAKQLKDELKPTDKEIDEQFEIQKSRPDPFGAFKNKSENFAGLAKDAVNQKLEKFIEQRVEKAKISFCRPK